MENQQTSENCFIRGLKLAHQSFAEFVNYFSPLLASRSSIAPSSEVWQYAERREGEREEEERGQIAYDEPEKKKKNKTMREKNPPSRDKKKTLTWTV